jgi:hypothetical protein
MERHEIATRALNRFPGAKEIAVRNFVGSLVGSGLEEELANLLMDAKLYGWNQATVNAIEYGIDIFYNQLN